MKEHVTLNNLIFLINHFERLTSSKVLCWLNSNEEIRLNNSCKHLDLNGKIHCMRDSQHLACVFALFYIHVHNLSNNSGLCYMLRAYDKFTPFLYNFVVISS